MKIDSFDSTTTTTEKVTFVDFIVKNGFYRDYLSFCNRYPQVKSRNKLAVMFLRHIGLFSVARSFVSLGINRSMYEIKAVSWL